MIEITTYNIDDISKEIIIHLSEEGISFGAIAVEMGISLRTLHRYIHKFNLIIQKTDIIGYKIIKPKQKSKKYLVSNN